MNKKFVLLLFVFLLAISAVNAADLVNQDFDGYFSMDVPKGLTFQKDINNTNDEGFANVSATYSGGNLIIMYYDTFVFSESSSAYLFQKFFEAVNPDSTECVETQEGDVIILSPTTTDNMHYSVAGKCSGNKTVVVVGNDPVLVKQMIDSAEFSE